jgi:hypothetical protein
VDEEGLHTPLLLDSLDLAAWTSLFVLANTYKQIIVQRLKMAHIRLPKLLMEDEHDAVSYALLAQEVKVVLKMANEDALNFETSRAITWPETNLGTDTHLVLAKLEIFTTNLNALEDSIEVIQSSHAEKTKKYNGDKQGTNCSNKII